MSSTSLPPSDSIPAVPESVPAAATAVPVDESLVSTSQAEPVDAAPGLSPAECAAELKSRFPALFAGSPRPLKLRIQIDIQARAPGVFSKQALSAFFRRYTGSTSYLIAASRAKERFDLDGQPAGELSEEHRQIAVQELARRKALQNERREKELAERRERAALLAEFEQAAQTPADFATAKGLAADKLEATLALARKEAAEPQPAPREERYRGPRGGNRGERAHAERGHGGRVEQRGPRAPRAEGAPGEGQARPAGQGPRRERDDRPRGPQGPRGERPQGERPQGARADRPQGERPRGERRSDGREGRDDRSGRDTGRDGARGGDRGGVRAEHNARPVNANAPKSALALALEAAKAKSGKG